MSFVFSSHKAQLSKLVGHLERGSTSTEMVLLLVDLPEQGLKVLTEQWALLMTPREAEFQTGQLTGSVSITTAHQGLPFSWAIRSKGQFQRTLQ